VEFTSVSDDKDKSQKKVARGKTLHALDPRTAATIPINV